jgi:hypothetical protein
MLHSWNNSLMHNSCETETATYFGNHNVKDTVEYFSRLIQTRLLDLPECRLIVSPHLQEVELNNYYSVVFVLVRGKLMTTYGDSKVDTISIKLLLVVNH